MAARITSPLGRVVLAIWLVAALGASAASADGLFVEFLSQNPANVVSRVEPSIAYSVWIENFEAGGKPTEVVEPDHLGAVNELDLNATLVHR